MRTETSAGWMALLALAAVIIAPPEAFGSGRAVLIVAATAAFLTSAIEGRIPERYLLFGLVGGFVLVAHSLFLSLDVYRSAEFLTLVWAYYCLFGFFYYAPGDFTRRVATTLVVLAGAVSAYGIYQFVWGLEATYGFAVSAGATEAVRISVLERLTNGRIFSTFALPGTLWGFLIMSLPLHAMLWEHGHRARNAGLILSAGVVLSAAAMTRSYGFVLGLFVVLVGWLCTRSDAARLRLTWKRMALVAAGLAPIVPVLYGARGGSYNPITLRFQNWLSAWEIFAAHPWGAGLNSYGVLYMQHQQPGANETQFAHNTPLQLLAELGLIGLVAALLMVLWVAARWERRPPLEGPRRYLLLATLVWLVHNLMDINVYFGSVGAVGVALVALLFRSSGTAGPDTARSAPGRALVACTGITALIVIAASGAIYLSGELLYRARTELGTQDVRTAAGTLEVAARINPFDSAIFHEAGQVALELYHTDNDPAWLEMARSHFARAIDLSPLKVGPHIGLALCFSSVDRAEDALGELEMAQSLHPTSTQASAIRRLVERRHRELAGAQRPSGSP